MQIMIICHLQIFSGAGLKPNSGGAKCFFLRYVFLPRWGTKDSW
jgi:hypothetical protein